MSAIPPLSWRTEFATGVAEIDEQHKVLVHTLIETAAIPLPEFDRSRLEQVTQGLLAYALYHFETEESLMQQYGYDDAEPAAAQFHVEQHRWFSRQVASVRESLKYADSLPATELLDFLNHWLVDHILNVDKQLGEFIRSRRESSAET